MGVERDRVPCGDRAAATSARGRVCAVAYADYASDPRVRREAEALVHAGIDVTVLALQKRGAPPEEWIDGVHVVHLPVLRRHGGDLGHYIGSFARFFLLAAWYLGCRPRSFDLVHAHSVPEAMVFTGLVQRCRGRPVLLDVHDLSTELYANRVGAVPWPIRRAELLSLRFADAVMTVHDQYRELLVERGVPPEKVTVILNVPDERLFGGGQPPTWPAGDLRLVYLGSLLERYGLGVALDAVEILRERIPGVRLAITGDGDYRKEIERRLTQGGLGDSVALSQGLVPVSDVASCLRGAHIGLVPFLDSTFTANILPTKLLEYVLMGIPAIVSRNHVIESYFTDEMVTYVPPGDALALAAAVEWLWRHPLQAQEKARKAQGVLREHSWGREREQFISLVQGLLLR